jgi:hypothetical protein
VENELRKRKMVSAALGWTKGTEREPGAYEQWLLEEYICNRLPIDEVVRLLEQAAELARIEQSY